ncbi:MAG TPA: phosphoglycerate dehydrogenase [Thermoanaerobaculia bacterium]|nr:phosphoglycerate dehydrogenase [Thermoanaerobaculia bacterium]
MHRILIADPIEDSGLEILRAGGAEVRVVQPEERGRLAELLPGHDALVVRSATQVTAELLAHAEGLRVVGRAGIGVDNVDVAAATERGILVVNAPTANVLSATEHTFALLLALARQVPAADASMRRGEWERKKFVGMELQGKALGVVGFGRIGQRVAARARAFEMNVLAYDPFLDPAVARRLEVELLRLEDLLPRCDVVTLHTPLTEQTKNVLDARRIGLMRPGALLVNCGRGGTVDEAAVLAALDEGRLAGAAFDVFAQEPPVDRRLAEHPRTVTTPHIGAQTREAQERIATETARMVLAALEGSLSVTAVNLPFSATGTRGEPFLALGEKIGRAAAKMHGGPVSRVEVGLWGIDEGLRRPLTVAVLKGVLTPSVGDAVNYVNAERLAEARGVEVVTSTHSRSADYPHLVGVDLAGGGESVNLSGALFGESDPRVVDFAGYRLEFRPEGCLLVLRNRDVPGVVGRLGSILGDAGINIADIHLARRDGDPEARAVLRLDQSPPESVLDTLRALPEVHSARVLEL